MTTIDRWVVRQAFGYVSRADASCIDCACTINLSGQSLGDESFLGFVLDELDRSGAAPGYICFEVTETAAVANLGRAVEFISALRARGCRFALDDFGSGLSSFAYLKNLKVDFLKMDGSFVRDMLNDPVDRAMVEAVNHIGHTMGIRTIAEFVEDQAILDALSKLGVDYAQGFHIAHPQPMENWTRYVPAPGLTRTRPRANRKTLELR
jgi:EAL domain-containing protein (putative c-di-GMP-specific phosphodiesterase class I)